MLKAIANIMSRIAPHRGTPIASPSPTASPPHAPHGSGARWGGGDRRSVVAKFDSAKTTPENRKHWANADGLSPNAAINPEVRRVLRNRARYEVANNSYAKGIVLTLANDTIGTGPRLQTLTEDADANARIEDAFERWSRAIDLPGKLRTMRLARAESGEAFALLVSNPGIDSPVSLDLKLIEADQVCTPLLRRGRNDEIDGIALDQWGNPSAYRVLKRHPGDSGVFWRGRTPFDDLTASNAVQSKGDLKSAPARCEKSHNSAFLVQRHCERHQLTRQMLAIFVITRAVNNHLQACLTINAVQKSHHALVENHRSLQLVRKILPDTQFLRHRMDAADVSPFESRAEGWGGVHHKTPASYDACVFPFPVMLIILEFFHDQRNVRDD